MRYPLRTLMIVLAIVLPLLEFGIYKFPEDLNLPGGMLAWIILLAAFWLVIPIAFVIVLVAAIFLPPDKTGPTQEPIIFRFTIRDVLWLTALVAMACGWWLDHHLHPWTVRAMQEAADDAGYYFYRSDDGFVIVPRRSVPQKSN